MPELREKLHSDVEGQKQEEGEQEKTDVGTLSDTTLSYLRADMFNDSVLQ